MLFPKKVKHRKWQKDRRNPNKLVVATRGTDLQFGSFGLRATASSRIKSNQIEAARKVVSRTIGKFGKYWIRIFPDRPITQKADGLGMGKGKGDLQGHRGVCRRKGHSLNPTAKVGLGRTRDHLKSGKNKVFKW